MTIRGHFNGTDIVLDEPVDLPLNEPLELEVKRRAGVSPEVAAALATANDDADTARRLAALDEFIAHGVPGTDIPPQRLRREHLYDDRI